MLTYQQRKQYNAIIFLLFVISILFSHVNSSRTLRRNIDHANNQEQDNTAGTISTGPSMDGPILSNAKPIAGGRGNYVPAVNFEDTAYTNDYWTSNDRLMEYKDKINEKAVRPEVVIDEAAPKNPNLIANIAAQNAVKAVPAAPVKKRIVPTPKPAAKAPAPKQNGGSSEKAAEAMQNTAAEITKQMEAFQKKS